MECSAIPAKVIASCFALIAFAAAVVIGAATGNQTVTIVWRAIVIMIVAWPLGYVVGRVAQRVNETVIQRYKEEHPILTEAEIENTTEVEDQAADYAAVELPSDGKTSQAVQTANSTQTASTDRLSRNSGKGATPSKVHQ